MARLLNLSAMLDSRQHAGTLGHEKGHIDNGWSRRHF
jgi:hypothetical protein